MMLYGYDKAYQVTVDSSSASADVTKATTVMSAIKDDMMWATLDGLSTDIGLAKVAEEWYMWNAWKAEGGEKKEEGKMGGDKPPKDGEQRPRPDRELMAQIINY